MVETENKGDPRHALAGTVGNILEWYDFAVYGFLAPIIGPLFFPEDDTMAGLIKTYGIFAAGYLMRPVGGIVFGHVGDRMGRKKALQLSIAMMAIPTVLVGLLPVYAQIGPMAALLLIVLRLLQGISVGGELIGSMSYLVETAPPGRRGLNGSWSVCGGVAGILLGSLVATLLNNLLSPSAMNDWGWRVPFLSGVVIFAIGSWLRRSLVESPDFTAASAAGKISANPLASVLREMPMRVLHMSSSILLFATSFYVLFVWMPTYLTDIVSPAVDHALLVNTLSMCLLLIFIPASGHLSDSLGRKKVMLTASAALGLLVYPLFIILDQGVMLMALGIQAIFAVLVGSIQGPLPAFLVESFPPQSRYTAIGLSYNITLAIFGGTAPLLCTWLIRETGDLASPALYLVVLAAISILSMALFKPEKKSAC
jgi:MHS family proline/betaine transporter-like MFS transporter